ncbi:hypothetical protein ASPVEDRAFT_201887 [Aspergillus versicolor CBS 583.65]|uniref:Carrier domain-containing protein n=1 Tax=Aspergillus versicolor CBS 583.65 TaxID=1036611 RepID=A0A1L9Q0E2_ASPVE|nr:uncharacterized protein ASPVEDRAFT_201887 [Aspergillus versicolor CBS 583.65]OJJ07234.1 hypothetical protein ASPVEDRAFT_201887 [Aspergillus versicolor CBS 583.65]
MSYSQIQAGATRSSFSVESISPCCLRTILLTSEMIMNSMQDIDSAVLAQICEDCHISRDDVEDVYACTPFQVGLLADGADYTHSLSHSLASSLDLDHLCDSLHEMVSRTETVRTRIVDSPLGLVQVVVKAAAMTDCVTRSLHTDPEQYLEDDRNIPMHLGTPLARFAIVGRKLVTIIHHAIADSYTHRFFFEDLCKIYQGVSPSRRAPFKEFANYCQSIDKKSAALFWKAQLDQCSATIFPSIPRGHVPKASQNMIHCISLPKGPPLPLIPAYIEAGLAMTVMDYTGNDSAVFGYALSGRSAALAGAETTLGPTVATVPMQVGVKTGTTVGDLLKSRNEFRRSLLTSPFIQCGLAGIRQSLGKDGRFACDFRTILDILPHDETEVQIPGLIIDAVEQTYEYALCLLCQLSKDSISIQAMFDPVVLPAVQVQRILRQMEHRVKSLCNAPPSTRIAKLPSLNFGDTLELLKWNREVPNTAGTCLHDLFVVQSGQRPDSAAVDAWDGTATYHELDNMSDNVAQQLLEHGISVEEPIPFALGRSLSAVVTVLGILKAGAVCVPVDVSLPKVRKDVIVRTVGARLVLTSPGGERFAGCDSLTIALCRQPRHAPGLHKVPGSNPSQAAYILFTSGSTGQPKGVVLEHDSMATSYLAICKRLGWVSGTRVLQFSSPAWDAFAFEIVATLIVGGCVCIPSAASRESALGEYINDAGVNAALQTPTALRNLAPDDVCPSLTSLVLAGEPIPQTAASTWGSEVRLFNAWGPCETSTISTLAELDPASAYPTTIGTPVGSAVWIVDRADSDKLVPIGAVGEMLVEGPGVGRGYYKNPTQTASRFISAPQFVPKRQGGPNRAYLTGDLARFNADGSIAFLGRQDNQVKIRGQRFELEEIEQVLRRHQCVRDIAMQVVKSPVQNREDLIACVALTWDSSDQSYPRHRDDPEVVQVGLNESSRLQLRNVQDFTVSCLPPYMVPTAWVVVNHLPKSASTKLDRARIRRWLEELDLSLARSLAREAEGDTYSHALTPPVTPAESVMQAAWCSVLGLKDNSVGRETSFLRLGGDSITAMQVATRCQKKGFPIRAGALLRERTLADVAREMEGLGDICVAPLRRTSDDLQLQASDADGSISPSDAYPEIITFLSKLSNSQPWLKPDNIDSIAPATDTQALTLGSSERRGHGSYNKLILSPVPGNSLDQSKLLHACRAIIEHHAILRTVFIRHEDRVFQIALRDPPIDQVVAQQGQPAHGAPPIPGGPSILKTLPRFYFTSDGRSASQKLELEIHHALYDAISMGHLLNDLSTAYSSRTLGTRPTHFHEWISHVSGENAAKAHEFWRELLQRCSSRSLVRRIDPSAPTHPVDSKISFTSNTKDITTSSCTDATIFKAAWALARSQVLAEDDIVFGYVNANRDSAVRDADQVVGPCISMLPVRARIDGNMTTASFVGELQKQSTDSIPYQHVGLLSVLEDPTQWPVCKFGSIVTFQNHKSVGDTLKLGGVDCTLSLEGRIGDAADIALVATPQPDGGLGIVMHFSSAVVPNEKALRMAACLDAVLAAFPTYWRRTIGEMRHHISAACNDSLYKGAGNPDSGLERAPRRLCIEKAV